MLAMQWVSIWTRASMRWTQRPSICAWRCFPRPDSGGARRRSRCTPCWTLRGNIPAFVHITDGKVHDVNVLDQIAPEAGALYVMDRGYIDFERLFVLKLGAAFFVVRTKSNVLLQRRYSH